MISLESLHLGVGLILLCTNPAPLVFIPLHFGWIMIALLFRCIPVGAGLILVCNCPAPPGFFFFPIAFQLVYALLLDCSSLTPSGLEMLYPSWLMIDHFLANFFFIVSVFSSLPPSDEGNVVVYLTTYDHTH